MLFLCKIGKHLHICMIHFVILTPAFHQVTRTGFNKHLCSCIQSHVSCTSRPKHWTLKSILITRISGVHTQRRHLAWVFRAVAPKNFSFQVVDSLVNHEVWNHWRTWEQTERWLGGITWIRLNLLDLLNHCLNLGDILANEGIWLGILGTWVRVNLNCPTGLAGVKSLSYLDVCHV